MPRDMKPADAAHLCALEQELGDLTDKAAEIDKQLKEVLAERERVRRLIAEKKNCYARIFTLPDELLVSIVEAGQQLQSPDPESALIEVTASQISQRFRYAILSASPLWSSIELRWGVESNEDRFAAYLLRSRNCTLSVWLKYSMYCGKDERDYDDVYNDLAVVVGHISRIRRLVLHCGEMGLALFDAVNPLSGLHAPYLEHLEIVSKVSETDLWYDPYVTIFSGGAPRLATLELTNVVSPNSLLLPVTTLQLRGMPATPDHTWTNALAVCPNLVDLTLDDSTCFASDSIPPISMPALRSLTILRLDRFNPPETLVWGCVLAHIRTPALESLKFSGVHGYQISSFFNNTPHSRFPALRSLTFATSSGRRCIPDCSQPDHIPPESLRSESFSALTSLTILNMCHMVMLVDNILETSEAADGSTAHNLPALQTLTLRYRNEDEFGNAGWPTPWTRCEAHPLKLRLPRSCFFTENDWSPDVAPLEIFDVQPVLQALGYSEEDEVTAPTMIEEASW
ncbi:hypothetical protein C8R46DRAFT_1220044 [Mycena filopes]|nr:hypothetical protein C8R46DRAFT_1220044 [Mycena filopes]